MQKKRIFNENGERGTQSIIGGNTTNLREWNRIKYDWAQTMYRTMLNNFWIPEEISLNEDVKAFPYLTEGERRAWLIPKTSLLLKLPDTRLPELQRFSCTRDGTALPGFLSYARFSQVLQDMRVLLPALAAFLRVRVLALFPCL